ncbi:hypothetical protein PHYC_02247 [Phycisphaerales bacterium]|nr:hypothetical protein PHYC_02247 [Phycisphaerales bacterium]
MRLDLEKLKRIILATAELQFGDQPFSRRALMLASERAVRAAGAWDPKDDRLSDSKSPKSIGLAKIDWAISALAKDARLDSVARGRWKLTSSGSNGNGNGKHRHAGPVIADRLRRLALVTGTVTGKPLSHRAGTREVLYDKD